MYYDNNRQYTMPVQPVYITPGHLQKYYTIVNDSTQKEAALDKEINESLGSLQEPVEATGIQDNILLKGIWGGKQPLYHKGTSENTIVMSRQYSPLYLLEVLLISLIPIPGAGSSVPYFFIPLILYLILRNVLVVVITMLVWVYIDAGIYFFRRAWNLPIPVRFGRPPSPTAPYDILAAQLIIFNPLYGFVGILVSLFSIDAFDLPELIDCDVCWQLIVTAILFFVLAVKQGEYIAWWIHMIAVPIFAFVVAAIPPFNGYDSYKAFTPYLFWILFTWYIGIGWISSNLLIGQRVTRVSPYRVYIWSVQGTYGWMLVFAILLYVFFVSIFKIIEESS